MKKWIALTALMLVALLTLSGCNLIGYDEELDNAQVVAKVNDTEITKAEWKNYTEYLAYYYQQYYQQYFGISLSMTDEDVAAYGESALEQLIQSVVLQDKVKELGYDPLGEEDAAEVEEYADSMMEFYKLMMRHQNYPDLETVEEEQERLAAEAAEETPSEPVETVATLTDADLDALLTSDLSAQGITREYFIESRTASIQNDKLYAYATADVTVTDEQVKAEFDSKVASQKESYDATPTLYASNATSAYYVPEGYRGVKNLLIKISDEDQDAIDELNDTLTTAKSTLSDVNSQLEDLRAEDTSAYDEETLASYNEQIAALEEQATAAQATIDETTAAVEEKTDAAFAAILPKAQEVLALAQSGEDFDALVESYGEDSGMKSEPNKTQGYPVCEGLSRYEQSFQDAAMALEKVGDVSAELVKTSYGYHILQYATDIAAGAVEYTDEIKESIHEDMLEQAQEAAYEAAVTQWVSEAEVKTYEKVMK